MAGVEVATLEVPPSPFPDSFMTNIVLSPVNNPQPVEQAFLQIMKDHGNDTTAFFPQEIHNNFDNGSDIGRAEVNQSQKQNSVGQVFLQIMKDNGNDTTAFVPQEIHNEIDNGLDIIRAEVNQSQKEKPVGQVFLQIMKDNENDTTAFVPQEIHNEIDCSPDISRAEVNESQRQQAMIQIIANNGTLTISSAADGKIENENVLELTQPPIQQLQPQLLFQDLTTTLEAPFTDPTVTTDCENFDPKLVSNQLPEQSVQQVVTQNELPVPQTAISQNQYQNGQNLSSSSAKSSQLEQKLLQVVTENSKFVTPLIKEDLRNKIKNRRASQGLGDLKVEFTPPRQYQLRPEEIIKRDARKMRNRHSAQVSRERRKTHEQSLEKTIAELEKERDKLLKTVKTLQDFKVRLKTRFVDHLNRCNDAKNKRLQQLQLHTLPG